jgi:branched-chain amino acid transport system substrate-binding protein
MRLRTPVAKLAVAVLTLSLLAAACGGGGDTKSKVSGSDDGPIKIGVVGPMTGLAAFVGKNMVEGIQLAVDDLNQSGGVLDRQVEFVQRDDEFDPAKTTTAVRELIEKEEVAALFGPASTTSYLSIARIVEDNEVPTWVIMAGPELTDNVNPYAFRAFLPDNVSIDALAEFAAKRYGRVAVVSGNDAEGASFIELTKAALEKNGKTAVSAEKFAPDETDFSSIALKVQRSGADVVIMGTHLGLYASRFASAARNLNFNAQLLGPAGLINYTYPDLARQAADGTIFVSFRSWGDQPKSEWPKSVATFYDAYVKRYLPDDEFSATGAFKAYSTNFLTYDMVKIWAAAAEAAGSADPKDVADELNSGFVYPAEDSVIGVPWEYSETNHDGIKPGDLHFYSWDLGSNKKFTLRRIGSVTDVLSGKVSP